MYVLQLQQAVDALVAWTNEWHGKRFLTLYKKIQKYGNEMLQLVFGISD